jgi:excinuclease ABC subunit B
VKEVSEQQQEHYDRFILETDFTPKGDQPEAIDQLIEGYQANKKRQTLLGATGTGKTFTAAHVIASINKPTLVVAHNKTLAAQLYAELSMLFPKNAVEFFVSFYDYYQPEAYLPTKDLYISKDFSINDEIERLRNSTTKALAERRDVIVVASVSCIYNVGLPETYRDATVDIEVGMELPRDEFLTYLVGIQYTRNEIDFKPKSFRAKGDRVEIMPIYQEQGIRVEFFGDEIETISIFDTVTGDRLYRKKRLTVFPATQYLTREDMLENAVRSIREELIERTNELEGGNHLVAAERIVQRTNYDVEQLEQTGYCAGIENYSRFFDGRNPGDPPYTLIDHFPEDFFLILDESHQTIPQIKGMFQGDFARKLNLVNHGFRLPSAYDNRPLRWEEFQKRMPTQTLFMSATPAEYEIDNSGQVVEQIIRPTGLIDPKIKRMAEDLSNYLVQSGYKARYMHSEIDTLDRVQILNELRSGEIDVLVGINLLREGLDLPEVSLVAILDADKEGFLRSYRSLIQTIGRASRNVRGSVLMYADTITDSMEQAITENNRRRRKQIRYNKKHDITPETVQKGMFSLIETLRKDRGFGEIKVEEDADTLQIQGAIEELTLLMGEAAGNLEFELAAELRDKIKELKQLL